MGTKGIVFQKSFDNGHCFQLNPNHAIEILLRDEITSLRTLSHNLS